MRPPADIQRLAESAEIGSGVRMCLARLPDAHRVVFVLRELDGKVRHLCVGSAIGRSSSPPAT